MQTPVVSELRMVRSLSRRAIAACVPTPGYLASSAAMAQEPAFKYVMISTETAASKIADHGPDNLRRFIAVRARQNPGLRTKTTRRRSLSFLILDSIRRKASRSCGGDTSSHRYRQSLGSSWPMWRVRAPPARFQEGQMKELCRR